MTGIIGATIGVSIGDITGIIIIIGIIIGTAIRGMSGIGYTAGTDSVRLNHGSANKGV